MSLGYFKVDERFPSRHVSFLMKTILTLTVGEFRCVSDTLSLAIAALGAAALFFLFSRSEMKRRFQTVLLAAGLVSLIGCYYSWRLFNSWQEAFELAGNSYAASGHPFQESYYYADSLLSLPLLLIALIWCLQLPQEQTQLLWRRFINASIAMVTFGYIGKISSAGHGLLISWSWWILMMIPFGYLIFLLWGDVSHEAAKKQHPIATLFVGARNLLLLSLLFCPLATLGTLCYHGMQSTSFVMITIGTSVASILSKCGVGYYLYRLALIQSEREPLLEV